MPQAARAHRLGGAPAVSRSRMRETNHGRLRVRPARHRDRARWPCSLQVPRLTMPSPNLLDRARPSRADRCFAGLARAGRRCCTTHTTASCSSQRGPVQQNRMVLAKKPFHERLQCSRSCFELVCKIIYLYFPRSIFRNILLVKNQSFMKRIFRQNRPHRLHEAASRSLLDWSPHGYRIQLRQLSSEAGRDPDEHRS